MSPVRVHRERADLRPRRLLAPRRLCPAQAPGRLRPIAYGSNKYRLVFGPVLEPMKKSLILATIATIACVV
jgi:hypothetical protein